MLFQDASLSEPDAAAPALEPPPCPHCAKSPSLCVCDAVEPLDTKVSLLILQHPQEQDRELGTARLAHRALKNSTLKIGLSWPSLCKALGREAEAGEWAVLHLGAATADMPENREVVALDKKGNPLADQDRALAGLKGVVIFDGSWAQAKTLWWRNAWVLKGRRLALNPKTPRSMASCGVSRAARRCRPSRRRVCTLARLERKPEMETSLRKIFGVMLDKYRSALAEGLVNVPAPRGQAAAAAPTRQKAEVSAAVAVMS